MKILLPVDGSPFTKQMLAWLATHQEWLTAPHAYTVVTVVPAIPPHAASMFPANQLQSYYDDSAEEIFKPIREFMGRHALSTEYVAKTGHAAEIIAKVAEEGRHDLIIMGSHGHGSLMSLVTGSVTTQVLARCKTPVLLVR
jgi:nucleotide-binding universal stress UspA family protein